MSSIKGRIAVDVSFADSTTSSGVQSLKTITQQDVKEYTTGKVAIVTGTAGTAQTTVANTLSLSYRNAAGSLVTFSEVLRVAYSYSGSGGRALTDTIDNALVLQSGENRVAISDVGLPAVSLQLGQSLSTGTYTIVIYGT